MQRLGKSTLPVPTMLFFEVLHWPIHMLIKRCIKGLPALNFLEKLFVMVSQMVLK